MSDYSKSTNFTAKDALPSGDPNKRINGSLFDGEFDPISIAVATKIDKVAGETGKLARFTASGGLQASSDETIPTGTSMAFFQAAAPTGWTQDVTNDDAMLRVVSGAGGGSGGSDSSITHVHSTGDHQLTIAEMPAHTHSYTSPATAISTDPSGLGLQYNPAAGTTGSTGGDGVHNHGDTGAINPKYVDMIICEKD